jgi:O-antigen/teichoic acid export membrane protein
VSRGWGGLLDSRSRSREVGRAEGPVSYARGARVLSIGIATTGVVTFAYFSLAAYALDGAQYSRIALLWSVMFVIVSVIYRPVEQLLSRTIAERRARGLHGGQPLRVPLVIQAALAATFLLAALAAREPLRDDLLGGADALFWILVGGVLAYAASYFARGWLAGHQRFALYGGLVLLESTSRCLFALAAVVGLTSGQTAVALGILAAPIVSLVVVPWAFSRRDPPPDPLSVERREGGLSLRQGGGFALGVLAIMVSEQTLLNGAVLTVDRALAGVVFSVLLVARAPLQLFQAVQGSLLPHLAGLEATAGRDEFHRAVRVTLLAIAGFALAVAAGLALLGPWAMDLLFAGKVDSPRGGLALVALGMGCHLAAGTLNQAALARGHAGRAAVAWCCAAVAFLAWMLAPLVDDELLRAEAGYLVATALLCALLALVYRRGSG